jgi:hypothetical protein
MIHEWRVCTFLSRCVRVLSIELICVTFVCDVLFPPSLLQSQQSSSKRKGAFGHKRTRSSPGSIHQGLRSPISLCAYSLTHVSLFELRWYSRGCCCGVGGREEQRSGERCREKHANCARGGVLLVEHFAGLRSIESVCVRCSMFEVAQVFSHICTLLFSVACVCMCVCVCVFFVFLFCRNSLSDGLTTKCSASSLRDPANGENSRRSCTWYVCAHQEQRTQAQTVCPLFFFFFFFLQSLVSLSPTHSPTLSRSHVHSFAHSFPVLDQEDPPFCLRPAVLLNLVTAVANVSPHLQLLPAEAIQDSVHFCSGPDEGAS